MVSLVFEIVFTVSFRRARRVTFGFVPRAFRGDMLMLLSNNRQISDKTVEEKNGNGCRLSMRILESKKRMTEVEN